MDDITREGGHSALYFGETRDDWWNLDHLRLLARRWQLEGVREALDVGCGIGHWSRLLARMLPAPLAITGVDREARWVDEARRRSPSAGGVSLAFRQGDALALPFADASFDLVSCQTVLIHLADPAAALAEMARVLRPGGHLLVAEPNNAATTLAGLITGPDVRPADVLRELAVVLTCMHGKVRLGLGDNSLGESLPALIDPALFTDLDVAQDDRASLLAPPYATPSQRAAVDERRELLERGVWGWSADETRQYYEAGGGADFDREWAFCLEQETHRLALIDQGKLALAGGQCHYLFHARRAA